MSDRVTACYFYSQQWPEAERLLEAHVPRYLMADTSSWNGAYCVALSTLWDLLEGRDLLTVEGDIGVHAGVVPQLEDCMEDWCEFPHPLKGDPNGAMTTGGLACTRFSERLRRSVPWSRITEVARTDLAAPAHAWAAAGVLSWQYLDGPVTFALRDCGFALHEHAPPVRHLSAELGGPEVLLLHEGAGRGH